MAQRLNQQPPLINPTAFLIYEALAELGWSTQDAGALAEGIRRLALGLPAEDELSVILPWLGKCRLIHKLDQLLVPATATTTYRVPDLLAIFEHEGHEIPLLIEVKQSQKMRLSWRSDYLDALKRYADCLGLPLLVAWKVARLGTWVLVDAEHFQLARTNYHLTFEAALRNNLLGMLCGDFAVIFRPGVGMHFHFRKVRTLGRETRGETITEQAVMRVTDAYFMTADGDRLNTLGPGLWPLFLAAQHHDELVEIDGEYHWSFTIEPNDFGTWAHTTLISLLMWQRPDDDAVDPFPWRELLQTETLPFTVASLAESAENGIKLGTVQYILQQNPAVKPEYIG